MQLQQKNKISVSDVIKSIEYMDFDSVEKIKASIIQRDIYFKTHKKDKLQDVINDFKDSGYSEEFLQDLEQGLQKSSIYEN